MKTINIITITLFFLGFGTHCFAKLGANDPNADKPKSGAVTQEEYTFLKNFLDQVANELEQSLEAMTMEQWNYRPKDGGWTAAECMQHIILAEKAVFGQVKQAMARAADLSLSTKEQDAWLITKVSDRGRKVKTPLPMEEASFSKEEMWVQFQAQRQEIADYLQQENLPLRIHFGKSPYGPADAYQLFLVIAAHSMRHYHQIQEVLDELKTLEN